MGNNLPPGVTPSDIDKHFGEPEVKEYYIAVDVALSVEAGGYDEDSARREMQETISKINDIRGVEVVDHEVLDIGPR